MRTCLLLALLALGMVGPAGAGTLYVSNERDNSLTLIRSTQERRYGGRFIGVDLRNPDFGLFARAFGVEYALAGTDDTLAGALEAALARDATTLLEVRPGDARH